VGSLESISLRQTASGTTNIYKSTTNPTEPIFGIQSDINGGGAALRQSLFTADGSLSIGGDVSNNPNTKLAADGSAELASHLRLNNTNDDNEVLTSYRSGNNRFRLDKFGSVYIGSHSGLLSNTTANISLNSADGSGDFAGTINVGDPGANGTRSPGVITSAISGGIATYRNTLRSNSSTSMNDNHILCFASDNPNPEDSPVDRTIRFQVYSDGGIRSKGNIITRGAFIELEADDDTKYTATTNEDGEQTLVYNGAVLDVKDRLTKLDTALSGLKSALVSTTDHASLKAALITALADI
jgi:hypothetical protein